MTTYPARSEHSDGPSLTAQHGTDRNTLFLFATATLLGAFLVFQVQPVISKCVLPWFGGTPAVWTTCMLFFQLLLFAGYLYAHLLRTLFRPATQGAIHIVLLSVAALMLPIEPSDAWKPAGDEVPTLHLLALLGAHVGLPYFVLSSTGPLIQAWLTYRVRSQRIYRLYALSNAGSLVALLSYPFVVEPLLSVSRQSTLWSLLFCGFVLVEGVIAIGLLRLARKAATASPMETDVSAGAPLSSARSPISTGHRVAWLALPALASTMLLVVTDHVCQDVAVIPFLWVLPLSLYLLSFIICFDSPQWYRPKWIAAVTLGTIMAIQLKSWLPGSVQLITEASCYLVTLLGVCLLCHGEVARLKPQSSQLTQYYLLLSAGGATGGVIVAIVCPAVLRTHAELPITLAIATALAFLMFFACRRWNHASYDWGSTYRLRMAAVGLMLAPFFTILFVPQDEIIASERNFFGVLQVLRDEQGTRLVHGRTIHGMQRFGEHANQPTTYYGRHSGVGLALASQQERHAELNIGVVGLGCGVLACYGRPGDSFDMIEINPAVVAIARKHFTFIDDSPASISTHLGDGRLVLERMAEARYDVLVLDAFSSDAIPAHLLTREAFALYRARLQQDGVMAVHVSNNHLDLVPLVHRLAEDAGLHSRVVRSSGNPDRAIRHATWVLIGEENDPRWQKEALSVAKQPTAAELAEAPLWTDQRHDLVSVLRLW